MSKNKQVLSENNFYQRAEELDRTDKTNVIKQRKEKIEVMDIAINR
jgi:hypothetical protein